MTTSASIAFPTSSDHPNGPFDVERVRLDFPLLHTLAGSPARPIIYLDNGATTQKPQTVIDAVSRFYTTQNSNIHRAVYALSQTATALYEVAREKIRTFINAADAAEIIFTRGTTEGINLVASSWGRAHLTAGDLVVISHLEHHSNIVPWQMICAATRAELKVIPVNNAGELILEEFDALLATGRVRMVAVNHVSNSIGTINPVRKIIEKTHAAPGGGAVVLVDGAQWVAHGKTDVQALDADFYVFSGHKMIGPTGIGILYGKRKLLEAMPPYQGGGDMIESVRFEKTTYAPLPNKFEAGTPDIAGVVGLGAAVDYLVALGLEKAGAYERELGAYASARIAEVPGLRIIGTAHDKAAVVSFVMDGISTLDIGMKLDRAGICVRTGHHCCQPVMERYGIPATARASFAFYNTYADADALVSALKTIAAESAQTQSRREVTPNAVIAYPKASAKNVHAAADALAEDFSLIEDSGGPESKQEYVLDMARTLPHLFDLLKQVTQRVPGCMSQVHLVGREQPGNKGIFEFVADADAEIVRGLIALLQRLYSGQRAAEVATFDVEGFFHRIGLDQFITSQRRNGLAGMVAKIRSSAGEIAART